jgi:RNA polymerase-binding protein DksA
MTNPERNPARRRGSGSARKAGGKKDTGEFKSLLVNRKESLLKVLHGLEEEGLRDRNAAGEVSSLPVHLADLATDTFEQDLALGRVEDVSQEIRTIEEALTRLREGTFGVCEQCEKKISVERLRAIPYTRLCLDCQRQEEEAA